MSAIVDPLAQSSLNASLEASHNADAFLSSTLLKRLLEQGEGQLDAALLQLPDGRRFALQDAVRILGNIKQETDPYGLTGVVITVRQLLKRGFSLNASQAALRRVVYDIEYGYLLQSLNAPQAKYGNR